MPKTAEQAGFLAGVIEGFYGHAWSHSARLIYARYLAQAGLNTYLYCPKSDHYLRKQWNCDWPTSQWTMLAELGSAYVQHGLLWGVGLSPFALYREYAAPQKAQLREKVIRLSDLGMPLLAILFDDMPGDVDQLACRQAEIIDDVTHWVPDIRLLVCPTYYSFDPVLEKHFGCRPDNYWPDLGAALPVEVDIFWTGNQVCSDAISQADVGHAAEALGRAVVLWDNYPVNDGAVRSRHLYLESLPGRSLASSAALRGHLCNPMNQAILSMSGLMGLVALYGNPSFGQPELAALIGEACWRQLQQNAPEFQEQGLDGISPARRRALVATYSNLPGDAAREVTDWLQGVYTFDPACLTD